jgi:hypothetical protein
LILFEARGTGAVNCGAGLLKSRFFSREICTYSGAAGGLPLLQLRWNSYGLQLDTPRIPAAHRALFSIRTATGTELATLRNHRLLSIPVQCR